jgi:hypothetical protein
MNLARRRFLLAGCVAAGGASRPVRAAGAVDKVLVVGDSQAQGLAGGLQRLYRHEPSCRVVDRSRISTGLVSPARFDWPGSASGIAETEPGAVAVVMFGANDRPPIRVNGHVEPSLEAAFCTSYSGHIRATTQGLQHYCSAVIWVGHPIVRDPVYADDMAMLNRLYASQAIGADWFPSWPLFVDDDGNYTAYGKSIDGPTTRLRADDGVHFTPAGYDVLAKALLPVIGLYRTDQNRPEHDRPAG